MMVELNNIVGLENLLAGFEGRDPDLPVRPEAAPRAVDHQLQQEEADSDEVMSLDLELGGNQDHTANGDSPSTQASPPANDIAEPHERAVESFHDANDDHAS